MEIFSTPVREQAIATRARRLLATDAKLALFALLLAPSALVGSQAAANSYRWLYEDSADGVATWTSESSKSSLGAVKVMTRFALRPEALVEAMRDVASYPRWYSECLETRVLRSPAKVGPVVLDRNGRFVPRAVDEAYVLFFRQQAAMLDDRWAIIENTSRIGRDGSLQIAFRSLAGYRFRGPKDAVRMDVSGEWVFKPVDRDHTQVSYVVDLDLKTTLPDFLVRPRIRDAARRTLLALGAIARTRSRHAARSQSVGESTTVRGD